MAAAPGALLSAVTDNRINEFVFKAVLHVLVYAYMELAAIVIECKFCSNGTPILKLAVHPF